MIADRACRFTLIFPETTFRNRYRIATICAILGMCQRGIAVMAKVASGRLKTGRRTKSAPRAVTKKRVANPGGGSKTVFVLDANSPSFEEGLHYVFSRNVAKARRENKRLLGLTDVAPRKA